MDVMTLGAHNIQIGDRNVRVAGQRRPIAGLGQPPKDVAQMSAGVGVAILGLAVFGAFVYFVVAATGDRYTIR